MRWTSCIWIGIVAGGCCSLMSTWLRNCSITMASSFPSLTSCLLPPALLYYLDIVTPCSCCCLSLFFFFHFFRDFLGNFMTSLEVTFFNWGNSHFEWRPPAFDANFDGDTVMATLWRILPRLRGLFWWKLRRSCIRIPIGSLLLVHCSLDCHLWFTFFWVFLFDSLGFNIDFMIFAIEFFVNWGGSHEERFRPEFSVHSDLSLSPSLPPPSSQPLHLSFLFFLPACPF